MINIQPTAFPQKLLWLGRYIGWLRCLKVCAVKPFQLATKRFSDGEWFWRFVESQFDARYGVDTVEIVPVSNLDLRVDRQAEAVFYEPTPIMEFGYVVSRLGIRYEDFVFIDVGSGKGRTLMLASWFPFQKITGVELSPKMHAIAEENILKFPKRKACSDISSRCEDATSCELPNKPLVLFLFNPFHGRVLEQFLEHVKHSIDKHPRRVILIYANPKHRTIFEDSGWLKISRAELGGWYMVYENANEAC